MFGADVNKTGVQSVWIEVQNQTPEPLWLLSPGTDPDYFSPLEVAWSMHSAARAGSERAHRRPLRQTRIQESDPSGRNARGRALRQSGAPHETSQYRSAPDEAIDTVLAFPARPGRRRQIRAPSRSRSAIPMPRSPTTRTSPRCVRRWSGCHAVQAMRAARRPAIPSMPYSWASCPTSARRWCAAATAATRKPWTLPSRSSAADPTPSCASRRKRVRPRPGCACGSPPFASKAAPSSSCRSDGRWAGVSCLAARQDIVLHEDVDEARNLLIQDMMYSGGLDKLGFVTGVGPASPTQPRTTLRWRSIPHRRPARGPVPCHPTAEPVGRGASGLGAVSRTARRPRTQRESLMNRPRTLSGCDHCGLRTGGMRDEAAGALFGRHAAACSRSGVPGGCAGQAGTLSRDLLRCAARRANATFPTTGPATTP